MLAIRAHFDGSVIIPDEPITLRVQEQVVVLLDSIDAGSTNDLEQSTRAYYLSLANEASEDDVWCRSLARDSRRGWIEE